MLGRFTHTIHGHERGSAAWKRWAEKFGLDPKDICTDPGSVIEIDFWHKTISYVGYVRDGNGELQFDSRGIGFCKTWKTVPVKRRPIAFPA